MLSARDVATLFDGIVPPLAESLPEPDRSAVESYRLAGSWADCLEVLVASVRRDGVVLSSQEERVLGLLCDRFGLALPDLGSRPQG